MNISLDRATEVRKVAPFFREALSKASDKKKVLKILDRLHKETEMTYAEAQEEFQHAFPNILKREPPTPRRLLTTLKTLEAEIDDFDVSGIEKVQYRAKANRNDLVNAAQSLLRALQELLAQLVGASK